MVADPVQARLIDIIEEKKKGAKKAKAKPSAEPEPPSNVVNIMDALRRSVAAAAKKTKGRSPEQAPDHRLAGRLPPRFLARSIGAAAARKSAHGSRGKRGEPGRRVARR